MRTQFALRTRFRRPLAIVAAAALLLMGCGDDGASTGNGGGGGTLTAEEYAQGMCGAASNWMTALQDRNTQLQDDLGGAPSGDLSAIKELMVAFLGGAVQDTETLIDEVSALSPPDVENGAQIHASVLSAFTQARDLFADARDQVDGLDPNDAAAFTQALSDLGTTLSEAGTEIAASFGGLENEELGTAFDDTPACAEVSA